VFLFPSKTAKKIVLSPRATSCCSYYYNYYFLSRLAVPPGIQSIQSSRLGPLGQPIRRINTFTASLPSFAEGEEKSGAGGGDLGTQLHLTSHNSSEEDLVKQLLGGQTNMSPPMDQLLTDE